MEQLPNNGTQTVLDIVAICGIPNPIIPDPNPGNLVSMAQMIVSEMFLNRFTKAESM